MPFDFFGYSKKRYPELLEENKDLARELWGEDTNLDSNSTLGKFVEMISFREAIIAEEVENLYNSRSIKKSTGQALVDNLSDWLQVPLRATYATGEVTLSLSQGAVIKAGTLFRRQGTNVLYELQRDVRANGAGNFKGSIEAMEKGDIGNARANEITVIVNDVYGLESVTNEEPLVNGQDEETDEQMKERFERSRALSGTRRIEAIESNILQRVQGLKNAAVIENDTMEVKDGIPPKAIHTIYAGGNGEDVARIVFEKKGEGIQAFGQELHVFQDSKGADHSIGVTPASEKDLYIKVTLNVNRDFEGIEKVKEAVYKHIGGYYGGELYKGINMGGTLYATQLETAIGCSVGGINDMTVEFSEDGITYERKTIPLASYETFRLIEVEVTTNG